MKNIYPKERTILCKDEIEINVSSRLKEEGLEENMAILKKLAERARMLIFLTKVEETRMFFDILLEDTIISIGYFLDKNKYYITRIGKNQKKSYIQFLKQGILVYFSKININVGYIIQPSKMDEVLVEKVKKVTLSQLPKTLIEYFEQKNQEKVETSEEPMIGENLERLLNLATIYNKYEKEKGKQQCHKMPLNYTKIESQAEYENTYIFYVGNVQDYQENMYVKLANIDNEESNINGQVLKIVPIHEYQNRMYIQFSEPVDFEKIPSEGRIHCIYQDVQNRVREKVIENIEKGKIPAQYLYKTLENFTYLPFREMDFSKLEENMKKEKYSLNPSQVKAVEKGIASQDLSLILGPPGTGKTTVIAWWVKYFLKQNKRILISSQNNSAVDNVIERIGKEYKNIIRIGDEKKIAENVKEFLYTNKLAEFKKELLNATEKNIEKEKQIVTQKGEKGKQYLVLRKMEQRVKEQQEKIRENQMKLKQEIKTCKDCYQEYQKLQKKKTEIEKKININRNQSNKFIRFFAKILNKVEQARYEKIQEEIKSKRNKYKQSKKRMNELVKNTSFIEEIKKLKENQEKLEKVPKEERENLSEKINKIQQEIEKSKQVVEALSDWDVHIKERNDVLTAILLESIQVVGATCIGIQSRKLFADTTFDVAIVDEAGQIQIHNIMVPISRAKKSILLRRS